MKKILLLLTILIPNILISQGFFGYRIFLQNPFSSRFTTFIGFDSTTTTGVDVCCDAVWPFGNSYLDLNSQINNEPFIFNYLPIPTQETFVPLYSTANPDTGAFTIGIDMRYGDTLNTFGFFKDNNTNQFHLPPYQTHGPVSGQRFTFYTTAPVSIEVINGCDYNGGNIIIHNPNNIQSAQIYKNNEPFIVTNDTIISGLESAIYQYKWTHPVGQEQTIEFSIDNTYLNAELFIPYTTLSILDPIIAPEVYVQYYSEIIWNFGDGTPFVNNDTNPIHIYEYPGIYTLSVTIISVDGCIKTLTREIIIYQTTNIDIILKNNKIYPLYYGLDGRLMKSN